MVVAALTLCAGTSRSEEPRWVALPPTVLPVFNPGRARALYDQDCRLCHGRSGDGQGAAARDLQPPPRDFTRGVFKFRATPSGELPSAQDLFDTLTRGMPGTAMPSWRGLSVEDRWQLVQLVLAFSPRFREGERPKSVLEISAVPPSSRERIAKGREVFAKMQCASCHGEGGRGDGPSSLTLRDDLSAPIYPFNLTRGRNYRGGSSPEDIYRDFITGLDGTPMPSYAGSLSEDEAWSLVHYIRSLFGDVAP